MATTDYTGRTIDLLAFPGAKAAGESLLRQILLEDGGYVCTGVQKLAQRWTLRFLTRTGSMPHLPAEGCDFLTLASRGSLRTESDVALAFSLANAVIRPLMFNEESADDPADERFADASLTKVEIGVSSLHLFVTVSSLAGSTRQVILPVNVVP